MTITAADYARPQVCRSVFGGLGYTETLPVDRKGVPGRYKVRLYDDITGAHVASGVSSSAGEISFWGVSTGRRFFAIAFDKEVYGDARLSPALICPVLTYSVGVDGVDFPEGLESPSIEGLPY